MGKTTHLDGDNNPTSAEVDPAKLLEAALLQMDGIIAEAGGGGPPVMSTAGAARSARARSLELAQQLASSLHHSIPPPPRPDFTTASAILRWLQQNNNSVALNDSEERVRRLEADKESLQLQVQVLSEQVSAQSEKMIDLERALHDTRQRLDDAEQRLQKEMLQRSSLETQKLELLSKLSEVRLRAAERGVLERSPPPPDLTSTPLARPAPPRTPPANYGRQIERNTHMYSSLPRSSILTSEARVAFGKPNNMVVARGRGRSVPNLAEKEEVTCRGSPSPSPSPMAREARARLGSGGVRLEGDDLARTDLRASTTRPVHARQTKDVHEWDSETTCNWLESIGLETYCPAAKTWLNSTPDARGVIAAASHQTIEKELAIKHPMHKKKIALALADLLGGHGDALLTAAGELDTAWTLRWLEDIGLCGARTAASEASLDGRCLHRLSHTELHTHLRVTLALHALSVRRENVPADHTYARKRHWDHSYSKSTVSPLGISQQHENLSDTAVLMPSCSKMEFTEAQHSLVDVPASNQIQPLTDNIVTLINTPQKSIVKGIQVLRDNKFNPDTMIRRALEGETEVETSTEELARWSSHRVMQWLKQIDLAEYAPNLRGAGVHGGLMLLEPRFTAELLAALLNIPASKTLLRRHLTQRFNDLLGRDVIQQKRNAEQTLGYQPLTATTKYKVPKKTQFSLKRKKSRDDLDLGDLVCPFHDDGSGEIPTSPTMRVKSADVLSGVCPPREAARAH